jgi:branched-chain amino acid transport system permease protein
MRAGRSCPSSNVLAFARARTSRPAAAASSRGPVPVSPDRSSSPDGLAPILQVVVVGLITGIEYALPAVGMGMTLAVAQELNLALGAFFAAGAYIAYQTTQAGFPAVAGSVPAFLIGGVFGAAVHGTLSPLGRRRVLARAVVLFGLGLLAEQAFGALWGFADLSVPFRLPIYMAFGVVVTAEQAIATATSLASLGLLLALSRTRWGLAFDAAAADPRGAVLTGINVPRFRTAVFAIGCALASLGGVWLAPELALRPTIGRLPLVLAVAAAATARPRRITDIGIIGAALGCATAVIGRYVPAPAAYVCALVGMGVAVGLRHDFPPETSVP